MEALIWLLIILGGILLIFVATMGIALLLGAITITITSNGREFQPWRKPNFKPKDAWMVNDKDNEK